MAVPNGQPEEARDGAAGDSEPQDFVEEPMHGEAPADEEAAPAQKAPAREQAAPAQKAPAREEAAPAQKARKGKKAAASSSAAAAGGESARSPAEGTDPDTAHACQSVAMQAAVNAVNCSNDYRPRGNISPVQVVKLRRQSYGGGPAAWLAYEKLLRVCEPQHIWRWMPDQGISDFWRQLPAPAQADVTEVRSSGFRGLIKEHIGMRTCYIKDLMAVCNEVYMLDDTHSIAVFQEFFRIAVSENACIAVNWQTVQAIDSTIQDFIKARVLTGELQDRVDPRDFPRGSSLWCQHREREHTRLALMCLTLEIFERRLLSMWEWQYGTARRQAQRKAAEARKAAEDASLDVIGTGSALARPGARPKGSEKSRAESKADQAAWKAADDAAAELMAMEEKEEAKKQKGRGAGAKKKKLKKPQERTAGTGSQMGADAQAAPEAGEDDEEEEAKEASAAQAEPPPPEASAPAPFAPAQRERRKPGCKRGGGTTGGRAGAGDGAGAAAGGSAGGAALELGASAGAAAGGGAGAAAAVGSGSRGSRKESSAASQASAPAAKAAASSAAAAASASLDRQQAAKPGIPAQEADDDDDEEDPSSTPGRGPGGDEGTQGKDGENIDDFEEELQAAQARVDAEEGDDIDAEFNRLVLQHLKQRSVAAQDEVVDAYRSATVIKKLCQKLEVGLQSAMSTTVPEPGPGPSAAAS